MSLSDKSSTATAQEQNSGRAGCCKCATGADDEHFREDATPPPAVLSGLIGRLHRFGAWIRRRQQKPAAAAGADAGIDLQAIDRLIEKMQGRERGLIELLQDVSGHFNYLPPEALQYISIRLEVPLSRLYALATFYQDFKLLPQGEHRLVICTGTACHVKGAAAIVDVLCRELNLQPGETTKDHKLTLATVNCIGLCGVSPVAMLDGEYHGNLTPEKALELVKSL